MVQDGDSYYGHRPSKTIRTLARPCPYLATRIAWLKLLVLWTPGDP
uniref:Uncharacterized protein n=1 Tax=Anguilla anguilla TaxID=7936 RepID=A0A0E9R189_ANGAN